MELLSIFGSNVKKYRELHELSQEEFAHRLEINFSNISRIESGKQFVTAEILQSISNILSVSVNKLFETEEAKEEQKEENSYKEKLINYIVSLTEEDAQYIYEA